MEEQLLRLRGHAAAGVRHEDLHKALISMWHSTNGNAALFGKLGGITNQVIDHLFEPIFVRPDGL